MLTMTIDHGPEFATFADASVEKNENGIWERTLVADVTHPARFWTRLWCARPCRIWSTEPSKSTQVMSNDWFARPFVSDRFAFSAVFEMTPQADAVGR